MRRAIRTTHARAPGDRGRTVLDGLYVAYSLEVCAGQDSRDVGISLIPLVLDRSIPLVHYILIFNIQNCFRVFVIHGFTFKQFFLFI